MEYVSKKEQKLIDQVADLQEQIKKLSSDLKTTQKQLSRANKELKSKASLERELKQSKDSLERELKQSKASLERELKQSKKLSSDLERSEELIKELKQSKATLERELKQSCKTISNLNNQIDDLNLDILRLEKKLEDLNESKQEVVVENEELKKVAEKYYSYVKERKSIINMIAEVDPYHEVVSVADRQWAKKKTSVEDFLNSPDTEDPDSFKDIGSMNKELVDAYNKHQFRVKGLLLFDELLCPKSSPKTGIDFTHNERKIIHEWYAENIEDYEEVLTNNKIIIDGIYKDRLFVREEDELNKYAYKWLYLFLESFASVEVLGS